MLDRTSGAPGFLDGVAGEMATLIRGFDWSATSIGSIASWPQSLRSIVEFLVRSRAPIVLLWGVDGVMIYNDAYTGFVGSGPTKLGMNVVDAWPEVADFNRNVMRVGLGGGSLSYKDLELTLFRDGRAEAAWMNLEYSPVIDETGRPAGVIAFVVETTARVKAIRRLAVERERQQRLLQQMPGFAAVMRGPEHVFEYVNDAYVRITGRSDYIGKTVREALPDVAGQGFFELLDHVYASGQTHVARAMELRLEGSQGTQYVDFVYQPVRDDAGAITGIFVGGYEVTEAHRTAAALRDSEARLRALNADLERRVIQRTQARGRTWQVSPDLLGALNAQGYFETSNPAWQSVLGWSEAEVASMSIFELLHPDDVERTRAGFNLTQQGQPAIRFPNRYRCKDGSYRWISWVGVPEDGMVYCSGRDITEEIAAQTDLEHAQEALRQAQKMEAVGQLTGGIAHDFNNLLAGISGSLEVIAKRVSNNQLDNVFAFIEAAQASTKRAATLTQRLLAFSRRQTLDPKPTDINRLVAGMEELIRRSVGPTIAVEVVGAAGLWLTKIDAPQLESALLNLAINARDAMPDGGRLTIETANKWLDDRAARGREVPPGQYLSLCVTDTGTGMSAEMIDRIFEPFFTTKPLGQGTGLGLSMVHGFVRQSGGQVRVYSEPGKGTTMCLYFPRYFGTLDQSDDREPTATAPGGSGETVLVVDDEPTVRMLILEVLAEAGYGSLEAEDGPAALKLLRGDHRIDLLITDVGLPGGMNGRQVADVARIDRPGLKVLFVTGFAENAVVGNGHLDPGMEIITKPFAMSDLAAKIREMLLQL
jgi:PAS domain S-box-containing protein